MGAAASFNSLEDDASKRLFPLLKDDELVDEERAMKLTGEFFSSETFYNMPNKVRDCTHCRFIPPPYEYVKVRMKQRAHNGFALIFMSSFALAAGTHARRPV